MTNYHDNLTFLKLSYFDDISSVFFEKDNGLRSERNVVTISVVLHDGNYGKGKGKYNGSSIRYSVVSKYSLLKIFAF